MPNELALEKQRLARERAAEAQRKMDKRKQEIEIRALFQQTKNYHWNDPTKHTVMSLAKKFSLSTDDIKSIII